MSGNFEMFKAYDVRGRAGSELNPEFCRALGEGLTLACSPAKVVIGRDVRHSSPILMQALADSLIRQGIEVSSLGICGTEEMYYAAANGDYDLGIMITGSHNLVDENGFKFVRRGAIPVGAGSGLDEIAGKTAACLDSPLPARASTGRIRQVSVRDAYLEWLLAYSGLSGSLPSWGRKMRVVLDAGNGCAGPLLELFASSLPVEIIPLNFEPDGSFPNGVPNPLLPEKRGITSNAVRKYDADLGVAFDGDFDRCCFFDHKGRFVESCYLIGLLAAELLALHPGEKIIHDVRVYWNTRDLVYSQGGLPVMSRAGHSYMKEKMRQENAIYGAEMSGHHFYRDFNYCDSGMLTMLLMLSMLLRSGQSLSELVEAGISAYPCSGEINFMVSNSRKTMDQIWRRYKREAIDAHQLDGICMEFPGWRFNLRASNTEPVLRLNVESRGDPELVEKKVKELSEYIGG